VADVVIIQHGEKERSPGDPGLTARGLQQANATGVWVRDHLVASVVWSSPLRRAVQTADVVAGAIGAEVRIDDRLRERMNWDGPSVQSLGDFFDDWEHATRDRSFVPLSGDSYDRAARRFRG
jgi:broad specificity phosphatase PhoE